MPWCADICLVWWKLYFAYWIPTACVIPQLHHSFYDPCLKVCLGIKWGGWTAARCVEAERQMGAEDEVQDLMVGPQHPPLFPPIPVYTDFAWKPNELLWWWQQGLEQPQVAINHPCRLLHSRVALLLKTVVKGELVCYRLNCWTDLKGLSSYQFILWDFTFLMYSRKKRHYKNQTQTTFIRNLLLRNFEPMN